MIDPIRYVPADSVPAPAPPPPSPQVEVGAVWRWTAGAYAFASAVNALGTHDPGAVMAHGGVAVCALVAILAAHLRARRAP